MRDIESMSVCSHAVISCLSLNLFGFVDFYCGDGTFVSMASICDGYQDCYNGDDETAVIINQKIHANTRYKHIFAKI